MGFHIHVFNAGGDIRVLDSLGRGNGT